MQTNAAFDCLSVPVLDTEHIGREDAQAYEDLVNSEIVDRYPSWARSDLRTNCLFRHLFKLPSPVVTVEFLSDRPEKLDMIGCRMDGRGLGLVQRLGIPVLECTARELSKRNISTVALYPSPRRTLSPEHAIAREVFSGFGIQFRSISEPRELPSDAYSWFHGKQSELGALDNFAAAALERSIFGPFEYANDRRFLIGVNGTVLSQFGSAEELYRRFPQGFVVCDMGTGSIKRFEPEPDEMDRHHVQKYEKWHKALSHLRSVMASPRATEYLVQERRSVRQRKITGRVHHEHRHLCFVAGEKGFRLVGGYAVAMPHGSPVKLGPSAQVRPLRLAA